MSKIFKWFGIKFYAMWDWFKKLFKDVKRVRWPKTKETNNTFLQVIVFVGIIAITLFGLAIGLTALWNAGGVGING